MSVFQALNMNKAMTVIIISAIALIPLVGFAFYQLTHHFSRKAPVKTSFFQTAIFICVSSLFLVFFEWIMIPQLTSESHVKYQKTLPLGTTLLSPLISQLDLPHPIRAPRNQNEVLKQFSDISISSNPNIYLFIIETFRKDFINEEIAPSLAVFAKENIQFPFSFANANSTQHSWFAIFHSLIPYHFTKFPDQWDGGSVPLQILKNLGYKIRVYSSADLRYFGMDQAIFGKNRFLGSQIEEFALDRSTESWQKDALALDFFERDIKTKDGEKGNLFLFFLDATHSEYSFPEEFAQKFTPITKQIDYLTLDPTKIEPIKNRYRNAVSYVDSLMDRFFSLLKRQNLYDEAIISITGDHGEEFFEDGSLFHGTHLNHAQTSVPIFFKFPDTSLSCRTNLATHIDIFPSILHFLTKENPSIFDGESIFSENRWPYRIAVLQNGAKTPCEFVIEKENFFMQARFINPDDLYHQKGIEILSLHTEDSKEGEILEQRALKTISNVFEPLMEIYP